METQDEYQLVTNVEFHSQKNLTFSVRHPLLYEQNYPKYLKIIGGLILIVGAATIIDYSVKLMIKGSISAGMYTLFVPLSVLLGFLIFGKKLQAVQSNMKFDPKLSYLEFESNFTGQKQILRNSTQLRIVVRVFPDISSHRIQVNSINVISVELLGYDNDADNRKVSKVIVATFRFGSIKDAQDQLNETQSSFKFMADWLQVPIVVEEYVLYEDSDTRYYF